MPSIPYDEFASLGELRAELGLTPGSIHVQRGDVAVEGLRHVSFLAWGNRHPEVVALHGLGQNAHTFDAVALALGRPLLAIDLPAHGWSDGLGQEHPTVHDVANDLSQALDILLDRPVVLLGMSLGGLIAIEVARQRPDLVASVVLVDITPGISAQKVSGIMSFLDGPASFKSIDEMVERATFLSPRRNPTALRRGVRHNARQRADGRWIWHHQRFPVLPRPSSDPRQQWEHLAGLIQPVTLVRGELAGSVVTDEDEATFRRLRPNDLVVRLHGGHSLQSDAPLDVAALLDTQVQRWA